MKFLTEVLNTEKYPLTVMDGPITGPWPSDRRIPDVKFVEIAFGKAPVPGQ